jgi:flagellar biosynthesis anti-sigma factor FlgM
MRIGLNTTDPQSLLAEQAKKPATNSVGQSETSTSADKTTLSEDKVSLSSLATQALNQPEVRQGLVDSLRQSISSGEYKLNPSDIADAILGR